MDFVRVLECIHDSDIDVSIISRCDFGWQLEIEGGQVARGFVDSPAEAEVFSCAGPDSFSGIVIRKD